MDDHFPGLPLLVICLICLFIFCLKKLTKYLYLRKVSNGGEEDYRTSLRIARQAYFSEIIAEPIIAEPINKSAEKPPSYALATKEINLPPPKYEEIVIQK